MVSRETTWELHLVPTKDNFYTTMGHIRDIFGTSFEPYVDYLVALSTSALLATYTLLHCHNNVMLEGVVVVVVISFVVAIPMLKSYIYKNEGEGGGQWWWWS